MYCFMCNKHFQSQAIRLEQVSSQKSLFKIANILVLVFHYTPEQVLFQLFWRFLTIQFSHTIHTAMLYAILHNVE